MKKHLKEPDVQVGIMSGAEIRFSFSGNFHCLQSRQTLTGEQHVIYSNEKIAFGDNFYSELSFVPEQSDGTCYFTLYGVTIGIDFHWEQSEDQNFAGGLRFIIESEKIVAINSILVEDYLFSVISSEMSATASLELLKAHAVISRSWLLAPMLNPAIDTFQTEFRSEDTLIKWYERDTHASFDVCADDHCQRYQGLLRARTPFVQEAINQTRGQVLTAHDKICDARFSKACGGKSELFENCWAPEHHSYLTAIVDAPCAPKGYDLDLTIEAHADRWIRSSPEAFCNTHNKEILAQVLNNYDQKTTDFYRWQEVYTTQTLSDLIMRRSGINFGTILELIPLERGESGRITRLKIVGTKHSMTVGKELEIRKWLSESHLYSSAFVIDKSTDGIFTLTGAGWGHGVGLCQIGAAVMGAKGYSYSDILLHYFRGATIESLYR